MAASAGHKPLRRRRFLLLIIMITIVATDIAKKTHRQN